MKCFLCKGSMIEGITSHVAELDSCIIIIKNVPCLKCDQFEDIAYIGTVAKKLEEIIDELKNISTEIAVVNYSTKVA